MTRWIASAPGKVVLLGEYAVLEGVPALVQAVDRRCRAELIECAPDECCIEAPQLDIPPVRFALGAEGRLQWQEVVPAPFIRTAALIDSVLEHVHQRGARIGPFRMRVDTAELFDTNGKQPVKLGLGSSAATAVAIDAVLRAAFLDEPPEPDTETVARLLAPGRKAQGNAGSGIDLAASLYGGLLGYSIRGESIREESTRDEQIEIHSLALPREMETAFIWAGEPASTADLLAAWRDSATASPREHNRLLGQMRTVASAGMAAVRGGESAEFLAGLSDYGEIMGKMNDLVGREVVTSEHRIASGLARRLGGVYKPCGAGGGDLGIAASLDATFGSQMGRLCRQAGLRMLTIRPDAQGVRVTQE